MTPPSEPRVLARSVIDAAVAAAEPRAAVHRALRLGGGRIVIGDHSLDLAGAARVWLVGAGKAAMGMTAGAIEVLEDRVAGGAIVVPDMRNEDLRAVDVWEASHPVPDTRGMAAAAEALGVARRAAEIDLVLCLLSGGASALWAAPAPGLTLDDLRKTTRLLLHAGAPIEELNIVRRHLSRIAGGGLARAAAPARIATLAISDVIGGAPHSIGSGPAVVDPSSFDDALEVLARYRIPAPGAVRRHLQAGAVGARPETLKSGELPVDPPFHAAASIRDALAAAAEEAARLGYRPTVVSDHLDGPAHQAGERVAAAAIDARADGTRQILLWGGETTVVVDGAGRGGRNQEVALSAASAIAGHAGITIAAFATDGVDGPTPAAGAVVDGASAARARDAGLDPLAALRDNDSYSLLSALDSLIVTGLTGTNVNDLTIAIID